jgi:ABC-2 type transport system ATP-binding protein
MDNEVVIDVENFTKDYGYGRGVFDVSFKVHKGECFGYLGPNGAGKSTTIRHIMGFSHPTKGTVRVFGDDPIKQGDDFLAKVGYLPGEIALPEGLNGRSFLMMEEKLRGGIGKPKRLDELLKIFVLNPDQSPKMMSLGDKRKLAVVSAFMDDPEVLILDKPTSGLDPLMQTVFIGFVRKEKARGKTILLSSHIFAEVDATCDEIAIIKDGRHVSSFKADDLKHPDIRNYLVKVDKNEEAQLMKENFKITKQEDGFYKIESPDKETDKTLEILSNYHVLDFKEQEFSLESYFMSFYKEKKTFTGLNGIEGNGGNAK